ncbi:MAG: PAS domain-containing sensor histidine kinase [Rhodospirillales bacterium]|nr:PAS domain-containing sensor histidine kinase [Rhodospirillales bacterium]
MVLILSAALFVSGFITIAILTDLTPLPSSLTVLIAVLNLDLVLALLLGAIIARPIIRRWITKKYGPAGSRLHMKMVLSFGLVAIIPALFVIMFLGMFLNTGMETWFSEKVKLAINTSSSVAQSYLKEHQKNIRGIALAMANDLNRSAYRLQQNPRLFTTVVSSLTEIRNLSEAVVVDSSGNTLARSQLSFSLGFNFSTDELLKGVLNSRVGEVWIISDKNENKVRAGVKLEGFVDAYLLVGKFVDAQVLDYISQTIGAANQYGLIERNRDNLQIKFLFVFALIASLIVLVAISIGWQIATTISTPIGQLIDAADKVRRGDLTTRIETNISHDKDEVGKLSSAFNKMTEQLNSQQKGLISANKELDERRRFIEVVLSGVSAGVIGLDRNGCIYFPNRSATDLLSINLEKHAGETLENLVPEMKDLLTEIQLNPEKNAEGDIELLRNGVRKNLVVSIAAEKINKEILGFVVTFDDVSELLSAQRKAAWADVARRIAHEIKNPLTPIQLAAERLKRRYKGEIKTDQKTFLLCTDTIIRQVKDIGKMVDEFSTFSRMPQPKLVEMNLIELIKESIFLEQNRFPTIDYIFKNESKISLIFADREQISRALTNILKNASESIEQIKSQNYQGKILIELIENEEVFKINISDNGLGFPIHLLDRVIEPYVTTRDQGTGLGLSIVGKIMEDHNGELQLDNNKDGGAFIQLVFKK